MRREYGSIPEVGSSRNTTCDWSTTEVYSERGTAIGRQLRYIPTKGPRLVDARGISCSHLGLAEEGDGEGQLALLPAAEAGDGRVQLVQQTHLCDHGHDLGLDVRLRDAREGRVEAHVLGDGHDGPQNVELRAHPEAQ
eukprot:5554547-Pyramimonas_sp.AAC.2